MSAFIFSHCVSFQVVWQREGVWKWQHGEAALLLPHPPQPRPLHSLWDLGGGSQSAGLCHLWHHHPGHPRCRWVKKTISGITISFPFLFPSCLVFPFFPFYFLSVLFFCFSFFPFLSFPFLFFPILSVLSSILFFSSFFSFPFLRLTFVCLQISYIWLTHFSGGEGICFYGLLPQTRRCNNVLGSDCNSQR